MASLRSRSWSSRWIVPVAVLILAAGSQRGAAQEEAPKAGGLSLDECINLGMTYQPALKAAQASLAAAQTGARSLNNLPIGSGILSPDLRVRREQACLGIQIASAGLLQAEWETRYAVSRNFYSVQYARKQHDLTQDLVERLDAAVKRAKQIVDVGDKELKLTRADVDLLELNLLLVKTKNFEAEFGTKKAMAALREAIGVDLDYPLEIARTGLLPRVDDLDKKALIDMALAQRGEMAQAASAYQVTDLEISAQGRLFFRPQTKTFASGADIHARPIPQGVANLEYRPGAIGLEMPVFFVGNRRDRMQRARDLNDRASAVVEKTHNLITLEVEFTYLKWAEAARNVENYKDATKKADSILETARKRFNDGRLSAEEYLRAGALADQTRAYYNEALYIQALALTAMERVTAGGYRIPAASKD